MKTDDFVLMLSTQAGAAPPLQPGLRVVTASAVGAVAGMILLLALFGINPELGAAAQWPMFWVKLGFVASVTVAALVLTQRLARPGERVRSASWSVVLPFVLLIGLAFVVLLTATPGTRSTLIFGQTWTGCPFSIALLSMPAFLATLAAMKAMAPTRLRLAGASAGLLAGAVGAVVYTLHCPELAAPFLGVWYTLGILIPAALGAALGPRLLRW